MNYKIIKEFRGPYLRKLAIAETKFGKVKIDLTNIKKGHKITIQSALNKTTYFKNMLIEKYPNIEIKLLSKYTSGENKILVKIDNIKYYIFAKNLLKNLPNVISCLDKTKKFIEKANKLHSFKYKYLKSNYISNKDDIIITCSIHGDFKQLVSSHLAGSGCRLCGLSQAVSNRITYTKGINNAIVYCLKITDIDNTIFYKIGFTRHSIEYRYSEHLTQRSFKIKRNNRIRMPYKYDIIFENTYLFEDAVKKEKQLHKQFGKYHYRPKISFDGSATECFTNITNYEKFI